jgi:LSD1 subclass zinc finger protein
MNEVLKCSGCGAPLQSSGGATDIVCGFCNATTRVQPAGSAGLIADAKDARELLKAIVSDLALWNAFDRKTPKEARDKEIQNGRRLFQRKVAPQLHGLYEDAIKAKGG